MSVYKLVEIVGTSKTSFSDAVRGAVQRASATLDDIQWFEVEEQRGRIVDGEIAEFQVKVKIAFTVHAAATDGASTGGAQARRGPTSETRSQLAQAARSGGSRRRARASRR